MRGRIHITEPDLEGLVQKVVADGYLSVTSRVEPAQAFIIAVPTPIRDDNRPDTSHVEKVARDIAPVLRKGNLVIIESTSPVGITEAVTCLLARLRPDLLFPQDAHSNSDIDVAYCPERVLSGRVLTKLVQNDRSIGGLSLQSARCVAELCRIFLKAECLLTDARTAEMVKLVENAYHDVNIAFANELSVICDRLSINVWGVIGLANRHPRVQILQPDPGVAGHCIALDPWSIIDAVPDHSALMRTAQAINDAKPRWVIDKVRQAASEGPSAGIACLGLAYKANMDDLRESSALEVAIELAAEFGSRVVAVEPFLTRPPAVLVRVGARFADAVSALETAKIVVLLVDHAQFFSIYPAALAGKIVIDTRGVWRHLATAQVIH